MSIADHPDIGPVALVILEAVRAAVKPGDSKEDVALICVAVASALLVESAAVAGKPETLPHRLERAQAFLASMVDFHVARGALELTELPARRGEPVQAGNVLAFRPRPAFGHTDGGGDGAA